VRTIESSDFVNFKPFRPPFRVTGAPNVILETIKRGESDFEKHHASPSSVSTVVLRIYEAYGGHARAKLHVYQSLNVIRAFETNLLEDEERELGIMNNSTTGAATFTLDFRGFEVKTVKLVVSPNL
jgi:alpha-mannosidase